MYISAQVYNQKYTSIYVPNLKSYKAYREPYFDGDGDDINRLKMRSNKL